MVARAPKQPLVEEEITVLPPRAGEVRVKVMTNACECRVEMKDHRLNLSLFYVKTEHFILIVLNPFYHSVWKFIQCVTPISTLSMAMTPKVSEVGDIEETEQLLFLSNSA